MEYSTGPVITENFGTGEAFRDPLVKAPPEAVVEQLFRGNPEALKAMLEQLGTSEEELMKSIEEDLKNKLKKLKESGNDGEKE